MTAASPLADFSSGKPQSNLVLHLAEMVVFADYLCVGAMRSTLPYHLKALSNSGASGVGFLESIYGLGLFGGSLLGKLSDTQGRKLALLMCFASASLGYALSGLVAALQFPTLLFISRLPIGIAKQSVTIARAVVCDVTPKEERSAALSRLHSAMAFGYAAGPWLGGAISETGGQHLLSWLCTAGFGAIAISVTCLLPETCPSPVPPAMSDVSAVPATSASASLSSRKRMLRLIGVLALPEAAMLMYTGTSLPLLAQHLGWAAQSYGTFLSATGLGAGLISLQPLPWLLSRPCISDLHAVLLGDALFALACVQLAMATTAQGMWLSLPLLCCGISVLRSLPASLLTTAVLPSERGEALGANEALSSILRVFMPTIAGSLVDAVGPHASFAVQAALSLIGAMLLALVIQLETREQKAHRD